MKKLSLLFVALVVLSFAPGALACAICDGENCDWGLPPDYWAAQCWYDFCPPCGCFTTGHCLGLSQSVAANDLSMEYRIASVEIRQNDSLLVAHKTEKAPAVVAEKQPVRK